MTCADGASVAFDWTVEVDGGSTDEYKVTAIVRRSYPAITSGAPDTWAPAEGGETEDLTVWLSQKATLPEKDWSRYGLDREAMEEAAREAAFDGWTER